MKKVSILGILCLAASLAGATDIFYYSPGDGSGGLKLAVRESDGKWRSIGSGYDFVKSDFGPWGSGKKMWQPKLYRTADGWTLLFNATKNGSVIGVAESRDLMKWKPQKYVYPADTETMDFVKNATLTPADIVIDDKNLSGYIINVDTPIVNTLDSFVNQRARLSALYSEHCDKDSIRFEGLAPIKATLTASGESKSISPLLMGVFFEDINYAADGGLYGELIQNRDFEYRPGEGREKGWGPTSAWSVTGNKLSLEIDSLNPIHPNNPHYLTLGMKKGITMAFNKGEDALVNSGYDGIPLKKDDPYRFSLKARSDKDITLDIQLVSENDRVIASQKLKIKKGSQWKDYETILTSTDHSPKSTLRIVPKGNAKLDLDMVSLFPVKTFKGRKNGLREDLAQTIADLKPQFVRFPGGCVAHGNGLDNVYDWKGSIGPLESRKPLRNIWGYHQTRGLGYHEYFEFCEDLGAEPLPVLAAGVPCQNSSIASRFTHDDITHYGQQGGLPLDSLNGYIQDILDLIEYANGAVTTTWGAKRADAGHPEPFNLKYIGIGNEDMITEVFEERFGRIHSAVKKAHPEITVVGTAGPFYEGADYDEGWRIAREQNVDMIDEHYYVDPAWLIYNQDFYDNYDRNGSKVYLGEWAAHLPGRVSNMETALAEALYLTSLERNGDIVSLSSYAPLLAKEKHTQWRPDLIYFSNTAVNPTTDYHTMRLYGENAGDKYFASKLETDTDNEKAAVRVGASVVRDEKTGEFIIKLVNLLPVATDMDVDLTKLFTGGSKNLKAIRTVMSGKPSDRKARIVTDRLTVESPSFNISLPPYSFTILRM